MLRARSWIQNAALECNAPDGWWAGHGAKTLVGGLIGLVQAALIAFSSLQIWKRKYLIAIGFIIIAILLRTIARIV